MHNEQTIVPALLLAKQKIYTMYENDEGIAHRLLVLMSTTGVYGFTFYTSIRRRQMR